MSVAVDAVGPSSAGQTTITGGNKSTWSHTVGSGSNRVLYVAIAVGFFSTDTSNSTTTATFNGVSMTSVGKVLSDNQKNGYVEVFKLVNPPTGANTVLVTCSTSPTSMIGGSISLNGVDQTTPNDSIAGSNFGNGTALSTAAITSAVGNLILAFGCAGTGFGSSTGTARIANNNNTQSGAGNADYVSYAGATSVTPSFTITGTDWWAVVAFDVNAAASANTITPAIAAETDAAQTVTGKKNLTPGLATSSNIALAVKPSRNLPVSRASETETSFAVTATKNVLVGRADELDSAQSLSGGHSIVVLPAMEHDSALSIAAGLVIDVPLAEETDEAFEVTSEVTNMGATLKRLVTKGSGGSALPAAIAAYDFSEGTGTTIHDSSGNGHDGEMSNQFHFTWGDGDLSSSGGSGDYVDVPTDPAFEFTGNFAIMCHITVPGDYPSGDKIAISKSRGSNADSYALYVRTSEHGHFPEMLVSNGVSTYIEAIHDTDIMDGEKHHLCGVYDGDNVYLYVDGVLSATEAFTGALEYSSGLDLTFMGSAAWPAESTESTIDNVRILDFAPTGDQVAAYAALPVDGDSSTPNVWAEGATLRKWTGSEWDPAIPVDPSTLDETNTGSRIATTDWAGPTGPIYLTQDWLDENNGGSNILSGWTFSEAGFNIGAGAAGIINNEIIFRDCIFLGPGQANASMWINSELSGDPKPAGFKVTLEYIEWDGQGEVTWQIAEVFIRGGDWSAYRVNCHDGCGLYRGNSDNIFIQECYGHDQADVPTGETVLNVNTDFSANTTNWTATGATLSRDTGTVHGSESASAKVVPDGATEDIFITSEKVDVVAARGHHAHAWFYSTTGYDQCYININWFDDSGTYISTSPSDVYDLEANTWTEVELTIDSPAGAVQASVVADESGTPAATDILYVSEITLAATAASPHTSCIGILSGSNVTVRDSRWSTGTADNIGSTGALVTLAEQQGDSDNIKFINNSAEGGSYSMYCGATGDFELTNSIFADNVFPRNIHRLSGTFGTNTAFVSNSGSNIFRNNRWGTLGPFNEDGDPAEGELVEIG